MARLGPCRQAPTQWVASAAPVQRQPCLRSPLPAPELVVSFQRKFATLAWAADHELRYNRRSQRPPLPSGRNHPVGGILPELRRSGERIGAL